MAREKSKLKRKYVHFPLGGLNRRGAYRQQPPYTTPDCLNVRAVATLEGRERGGSRPGLILSHIDDLVSAVRMLSPMVLALGDGFTAWSDTFGGLSMAAAWTQAAWASAMPSILQSTLASVDTSIAEGEAVLDLLPIDTAEDYTVEIFLTPWLGSFAGDYRLYFRLDNTTPDIETAGVVVEIVMDDDTGDYTASLTSVVATVSTVVDTASGSPGAASPGWLSATVDGTTVTVYWNGTLILSGTVGAHAGKRVGFGMECTLDGGVCLANVFRVQHYSTGSVNALRSMLVASAGGDLYIETTYGRLTAVASDLSVRDDVPVMSAQSGQALYIADYGDVAASGTDGTVAGTSLDAPSIADWTAIGISTDDMVCVISNVQGTAVAGTYGISTVAAGNITLDADAGAGGCAYRIERAPKVYDPLLNTIAILTATTGQVPTGNPLICRYLDRIVLAGAEIAPHVWYMARQGDPLDWDYAQTDSQRAVAGTSSESGVSGGPITALIPHSDDYLIFGCRTSIWRMTGDPAFGGTLNALSHKVGIVGPKAWCLGPNGELIFLSLSGIYAVGAGGNTYPIPISEEPLPKEFLNLNPDMLTISLEYDVQNHGVHIYLTPESSNTRVHWWLDWERKTFWPITLTSDHEPTATCDLQATAIEDSGIILGGRDGFLRRLSELAESDCGETFSSYVMMGPIVLADDGMVGTINSIEAVLAENSGDVTWTLHPSLTFEGAALASQSDTGTWSEGLNATNYPACRGQAFVTKITGTSGRRWAVEQITAIIREAGKRRLA